MVDSQRHEFLQNDVWAILSRELLEKLEHVGALLLEPDTARIFMRDGATTFVLEKLAWKYYYVAVNSLGYLNSKRPLARQQSRTFDCSSSAPERCLGCKVVRPSSPVFLCDFCRTFQKIRATERFTFKGPFLAEICYYDLVVRLSYATALKNYGLADN